MPGCDGLTPAPHLHHTQPQLPSDTPKTAGIMYTQGQRPMPCPAFYLQLALHIPMPAGTRYTPGVKPALRLHHSQHPLALDTPMTGPYAICDNGNNGSPLLVPSLGDPAVCMLCTPSARRISENCIESKGAFCWLVWCSRGRNWYGHFRALDTDRLGER